MRRVAAAPQSVPALCSALPDGLGEPGEGGESGAGMIDELERLCKLHDAGAITDDELARLKAKLIG